MRGSPQPNRRASFSIESIINRNVRPDYPEDSSSPKPGHPDPAKISVPITPYLMRGVDPQALLDHRLAHLAGVAANPHLGLSQLGYLMNPFYPQFMAMASHLNPPPGKHFH